MSGRRRPGSVSANSRRQNAAEFRGTFIPFHPFLQIGNDDSPYMEVEKLRYQTITMLPEYRNKSLDELRLEDYEDNRHLVRQQGLAAVTVPAFVPTFPPKAGHAMINFNNIFTAHHFEFNYNLGTNIQFQPFIGIDSVTNTNRKLEMRYQSISVMPEYCDKSIEELRLEDYSANRHHGRQQRTASTTLRPPLFRFGDDNCNALAAQNSQFFNFDSNRSQPSVANGSFSFLSNNPNRGSGNLTTFVVPENRNNSTELPRGEATANSQQATESNKFEDHALKIPLQSLALQGTDPIEVALDRDKFIATRVHMSRIKYCNVFVTFCYQIQTDQFIVIQILKTDPAFISGLRLYIKNLNEGPYLQRKLIYSDMYCKRNDFLIVWLSEDGAIQVIKNDGNTLKKPTRFSLPKTQSGQYQLLGDMCGSVEQLRAFIGDRKKAEPFPWKRTNRSVSSALFSYTIDTGSSSLSLICELRDDKVIPVDVDFSKNVSTDTKSKEISQPGSSNDNKLCKICIDNTANVVLIPCGHLCLCYECSLKMKVRGHSICPICRSVIRCYQKVYFS